MQRNSAKGGESKSTAKPSKVRSAEPSKSAGPVSERPVASHVFAEVVDSHLKSIGWNKVDLARASGLQPSLISEWKKDRTVQLDHVQRTAVGLALGYEALRAAYADRHGVEKLLELAGDARGPDWVRGGLPRPRIDGRNDQEMQEAFARCEGTSEISQLLGELMLRAGFRAEEMESRPRNAVFNRLRRLEWRNRHIRIGFFNWPGLAVGPDPGGKFDSNHGVDGWSGASVEITQLVMALLGVRWKAVSVAWPHVHQALDSGEVDLIGPVYLRAPMRMFNVWLSEPIPHIGCRLCAICNIDAFEKFKKTHKAVAEALERNFDLTDHNLPAHAFEQIRWVVGRSDVTEALARLLTPTCPLESIETSDDPDNSPASIEDAALLAVRQTFAPGSPLKLFPTELVTARTLEQRHSKLIKILPVVPTSDPEEESEPRPLYETLRLPMSFAARVEEKKLIDLINAALHVLGNDARHIDKIARSVDADGTKEFADKWTTTKPVNTS